MRLRLMGLGILFLGVSFGFTPFSAYANTAVQKQKLAAINADITRLNTKVTQLNAESTALDTRIKNLHQTINHTKQQQGEAYQRWLTATRDIVRTAYNKPLPVAPVFTSSPINVQRITAMQKVSLYSELEELNTSLASLIELEAHLTDAQGAKQRSVNNLTASIVKLEKSRGELLRALNIKDKQLAKQILASQAVAHPRKALPSGTTFSIPVAGTLLVHYGDTLLSGLKSSGVTVQSSADAPVKAIEGGTVLFNQPFRDYGHLIILESANKHTFIYGGVGISHVAVGQRISKGDVIAHLPAEDTSTLYLEVRHGNNVLNPQKFME